MKRLYLIFVTIFISIFIITPITGCTETGLMLPDEISIPLNVFVDDSQEIGEFHRFSTNWIMADFWYHDIPYITAFTNRQETQAYINAFGQWPNFGYWATKPFGLFYVLEGYSDEFFEDYQLIVVVLLETSGSIQHRVDVNYDGEIWVTGYLPPDKMATDDMAGWHIVIEVTRDVDLSNLRIR